MPGRALPSRAGPSRALPDMTLLVLGRSLVLLLFAFLCFAASTIWSVILRSWPLALLGLGLSLWVLHVGDILKGV